VHGPAARSLQEELGAKFDTEIDLPQGSVSSPLLFTLSIREIFPTGNMEMFTDGGSLLQIGRNIGKLTTHLESDITTVAK
jgi:hypothetical protein